MIEICASTLQPELRNDVRLCVVLYRYMDRTHEPGLVCPTLSQNRLQLVEER